jgi:hypothetical protein
MEVLALCVDRLGYRRGARVAEFIGEWEVCVRQLGHAVSTDEFAAWWRESRATAYRRLAEFRESFPELGPHGKPDDLMRPLLEQLAESSEAAPDLGLVVPT